MPNNLLVLGEYQAGKTIGQGAFSKVKIGVHKETGQKVAIKIIDKKQIAIKAKKAKEAQQQRLERKRLQQERLRKEKEQQQQALRRANTIHKVKDSTDSSEAKNVKSSKVETEEKEKKEEPEGDSLLGKLQPEVQLLMRLDHPNVIKLYQVMETENECYIIMEYAQGGELIDYIAARDRLTESEARKYFRQIISALDHCHSANVVHRDLKLENLLLNEKREILISDFGLGRTFHNDVDELMSTFCGTPNYAAVELISGTPYIGVKSDIWAMGVVLYIMVTGRPPFNGENISALYSKIKAVDYHCPPYFSTDLRRLLAKILVKTPNERATMQMLKDDPWVNYEYIEPPLHVAPIITGFTESSAQLITGITFDQKYIIYTIRRHEKQNKNIQKRATVSTKARDQISKRKSISIKSPLEVASPNLLKADKPVEPVLIEEDEKDDISELPELPAKTNGTSTPVENINDIESSQGHSRARSHSIQPDSNFFHFLTNKGSTNNNTSVDSPQATQRIKAPSVGLSRTSSVLRRMSMVSPTNEAEIGINTTVVSTADSTLNSPAPLTAPAVMSGATIARRPSIQLSSGRPVELKYARRKSKSPSMMPINTSQKASSSSGSTPTSTVSSLERNAKNSIASPLDDHDPMMASPMITIEKSVEITDEDTADLLVGGLSDGDVASSNPSIKRKEAGYNKFDIVEDEDTDGVSSQDGSKTNVSKVEIDEPSVQEIQDWHEFNRPPKMVRTVRFSFNSSTTSSESAVMTFQEVHRVLLDIAEANNGKFTFHRIPELYLVNCKLSANTPNEEVEFEIEVCKIWMLKLHGIRIKRLSGNPFAFKKIYGEFVGALSL